MSEISKDQLEKISLELRKVTLQMEQLNDRLQLLTMLNGMQEAGGREATNDEYYQLLDQLHELKKKKHKLQAQQETLDQKSTDNYLIEIPLHDGFSSGNEIFFVERPPSFPAPQIFLDFKMLPPYPSVTRCPYCAEYITTEVSRVVGNTVWLVCLASTFLCCFVGCCLIPFCINTYKDVVHKCPKCRSHIHTCTKL